MQKTTCDKKRHIAVYLYSAMYCTNKNAENRTYSQHTVTSVPAHIGFPHSNSDFRYVPAVSTLLCSPFPLVDLQLCKISSEMVAAINSFCFEENIFFLFSKMKTVREGYTQ